LVDDNSTAVALAELRGAVLAKLEAIAAQQVQMGQKIDHVVTVYQQQSLRLENHERRVADLEEFRHKLEAERRDRQAREQRESRADRRSIWALIVALTAAAGNLILSGWRLLRG
jgi:hypothetical protein